jgi:methylglyoxal synthase
MFILTVMPVDKENKPLMRACPVTVKVPVAMVMDPAQLPLKSMAPPPIVKAPLTV